MVNYEWTLEYFVFTCIFMKHFKNRIKCDQRVQNKFSLTLIKSHEVRCWLGLLKLVFYRFVHNVRAVANNPLHDLS